MARPKTQKSGSIRHDGREIRFRIIHRPRVTRRIHLELGDDDGLQVVAPRHLDARSVQGALQHRAPQVVRFLDNARRRRQEAPDPGYREGDLQWFLGREYVLEIRPAERALEEITFIEGTLRIHSPDISPAGVRERLKAWYRLHADRLFGERMADISRRAPWIDGVPSTRLRWMKRTWGSCSAKGIITLNPQLMKSPPECIEYVIAHEICHLQEHNHGPGFYALQEKLCPDWRDPRRHLRENAHRYLRL